jgi:hypothetical protein
MTPAFTNNLTVNRFQPLDFSRQGLQSSRPNPFDVLPGKIERRPRGDFGLENLTVHSLPGFVVQMIVQQVGLNDELSPFGGSAIRVVVTERNVSLKDTPTKYKKNGILVHHTGKIISSEDVANALAEE